MKVKKLVKWLQDCDQDSEVCLSRLFIIDDEMNGQYELILDCPIVGLAKSLPDVPKNQREVRFLLEKDMEDKKLKKFMKERFGIVKRFAITKNKD
jgi:hypothetical protein